jgi:hypothetical protein
VSRYESPRTSPGASETTTTQSIDVAAAWAGLLGVVLFVVGSLLAGSPPKPDASTAAVTTFLVQQRSSLLIGTVLLLLAIPCFGVFVGALSGTLREAEGGRGTLTGAATLGWTLLLAVVSIGVLSQTALVWRGADTLDPHLVRFGYDLSMLSLYAVSAMAVALAVGATSVVIFRTGVLPRWLVVLGMVEIAVNLIELAGLASRSGLNAAGYAAGVGPLIWSLWAAAAAVTLARHLRHPQRHPATELEVLVAGSGAATTRP